MRYKAKITFNGDSFIAEREEIQDQILETNSTDIEDIKDLLQYLEQRVSYLELPWYIKFKLWAVRLWKKE